MFKIAFSSGIILLSTACKPAPRFVDKTNMRMSSLVAAIRLYDVEEDVAKLDGCNGLELYKSLNGVKAIHNEYWKSQERIVDGWGQDFVIKVFPNKNVMVKSIGSGADGPIVIVIDFSTK